MKSITIHNLDKELAMAIRKKAQADGMSLNQTIKNILSQSILARKNQKKQKGAYDKFFGVWSKEEAEEFDKAINAAGFEKIDKEDWV